MRLFLNEMKVAIKCANELRERVKETFEKNAAPTRSELTYDEEGDSSILREDFDGVRWWTASRSLIDAHYDKLPLMTPKAYHYYLPAYILRSLDRFEPGCDVLEYTVFSLSPTKMSRTDHWFALRAGEFRDTEKALIRDFLRCILSATDLYILYKDAERGLRKFWSESE